MCTYLWPDNGDMRPLFWFLGYVLLFYPFFLKSEHFSFGRTLIYHTYHTCLFWRKFNNFLHLFLKMKETQTEQYSLRKFSPHCTLYNNRNLRQSYVGQLLEFYQNRVKFLKTRVYKSNVIGTRLSTLPTCPMSIAPFLTTHYDQNSEN